MQRSVGTSLGKKINKAKEDFIVIFTKLEDDVDMDMICVSGNRENADYFPISRARIGFSDGTLIDYDYKNEDKLTVLKKGPNFYKVVQLEDINGSNIMIKAEGIEWHVYEDIC